MHMHVHAHTQKTTIQAIRKAHFFITVILKKSLKQYTKSSYTLINQVSIIMCRQSIYMPWEKSTCSNFFIL